MPTASTIRRRRARGIGLGLLALLWLASGCIKPNAVVVDDELLVPLAPPQPWLPGADDLEAARLARRALVAVAPPRPAGVEDADADPRVEAALAKVEAAPISRENDDLVALAIDLRNATLDDPIAYRAASRKLEEQWGLDPRLDSRLESTIDADPIKLAKKRDFDRWHRLWARTFNTVSEPLGNSVITGFVMTPFQMVNSIIHYLASFSNDEPLSGTDRQALALRKEFLARNPDTELTETLERKIERKSILLEETLAKRRLRAGTNALDANAPDLALHHARAAIRILAPHPEENESERGRAERLEKSALEAIAFRDRLLALSVESLPTPADRLDAEYSLSASLLRDDLSLEASESRLGAYRALAGEAGEGRVQYVRAILQHDNGLEEASRLQLESLGRIRDQSDSMARHARAIIQDDWQNPYGAWVRLGAKGKRDELAWRFAGEWVNRPRYPNLPTPVAYLIDAPTIAMTIVLAPLRFLISPWTGVPDFQRGSALAGYRYLERYPDGDAHRPIVDWLYDYEVDRERYSRALRLADLMPGFDPEERSDLVEKTADDRVARIDRIDRRDARSSILKGVAREFPDSDGGRVAGLLARDEMEDASPQRIRITKGFLMENPAVASRDGMGLNPRLLNEDPSDGELHADGVILRGGRLIEIMLLAEGGKDKDPPEKRVRKISRRRLSQIASSIEETVQQNSLIDPDWQQKPDAGRDVFIERAGLGLTEDADLRPTAQSNFVYKSLRERYGMVRGRDSVLPFDLVLRGSLGDFTLGAFPRWRQPRETPDAFLYR